MGFFVMIFSMILGIYLTIIGISRRKRNYIYKGLIIVGIFLILFAVYLALPH